MRPPTTHIDPSDGSLVTTVENVGRIVLHRVARGRGAFVVEAVDGPGVEARHARLLDVVASILGPYVVERGLRAAASRSRA